MAITVEAIYENGVLKPSQPLPLQEQEKVQVTIQSPSSWVQETAGILGWTGSHEELRQFALDPDPRDSLCPDPARDWLLWVLFGKDGGARERLRGIRLFGCEPHPQRRC